MSDDTYNGWANRETWALTLHVGNDEGLNSLFRETVGGASRWDDIDAVRDLAETLFTPSGYRHEFGEGMPESLEMVSEEIGSMWRIDWPAVVDALSEE